ncbi:hypothetical protein MKW98_009967 [Papaver atlanticum]|uniref:RING-type E3 ubiquitin transferase (cysteine targeting) n=1 Tax=Papaver atlanticum TaxID=357466 RepID=A0AAD4T0W4_9MAGN|nr:hypothetical protein MKW98_009967 [Papaver atlanticum]
MKEEEILTLNPTSSSSSLPSLEIPSEDAWVNTSQRLLPQWQQHSVTTSSSQPPIPISISRVNQVDAARLDIEISGMLKEQLVKVFNLIKPGFLFQYEPELDAFLEFLIWRFSIWVDKPTPGNALMNLRYRDESATTMTGKEVRTGLEGPGLTMSKKIWYCLATVGGQYFWARLQSFSAFRRWGDSEQRSLAHRTWGMVRHLEGFYRAASFINLLIFLYKGWYRSLIERALKARLVYGSPNMNRAVSFEYMNRQLVWNEFSEMLLLLLPLLNSSSIRKILLPFSKDKSSGSAEDVTACPICQANPTTPFLALPCEHRYCYYCLRTRCAATPSFRCSRCNEPVVAIQRHGGPTKSTAPNS